MSYSSRLVVTGFDWDDGNREKCRKHGVTTAVVEQVLRDSFNVFPDPLHSDLEERFKAIGRSDDGRGVLIVFTLRDHGGNRLVRPISSRYMHRKELAHHEEEIARAAQR